MILSVSSGSDTVALQLRELSLYTPLLGVIVVPETMGELFSSVTETLLTLLSESESVAVAVQVMVSPTCVSFVVGVYVEPLCTMAPFTDQEKLGVMEPSLGSVALAVHVRGVLVYIPVLGDIWATESNSGEEFTMVAVCVLVWVEPCTSATETAHKMLSLV